MHIRFDPILFIPKKYWISSRVEIVFVLRNKGTIYHSQEISCTQFKVAFYKYRRKKPIAEKMLNQMRRLKMPQTSKNLISTHRLDNISMKEYITVDTTSIYWRNVSKSVISSCYRENVDFWTSLSLWLPYHFCKFLGSIDRYFNIH